MKSQKEKSEKRIIRTPTGKVRTPTVRQMHSKSQDTGKFIGKETTQMKQETHNLSTVKTWVS